MVGALITKKASHSICKERDGKEGRGEDDMREARRKKVGTSGFL